MKSTPSKITYQEELQEKLFLKYGYLVSGENLAMLLGFPTVSAFRQAYNRGVIEVPIITLKNRKGKFAMTTDIASWLTKIRYNSLEDSE